MDVGKGKSVPDVILDGGFVQATETADEVDMVVAEVVNGVEWVVLGVFLIHPVPGPQIHMDADQQLVIVKGLVKIVHNGTIDGKDGGNLGGFPQKHLILVEKEAFVPRILQDGAVGKNIGDTGAPIAVAIVLGKAVDVGFDGSKVVGQQGAEDKVLVFKVVGNGPLADAQTVGNHLEGGGVIAFFFKKNLGQVQDIRL